jgi:hypothetical protein
MGRRANPTLIGAFLVGAAALVVIDLLIFGRGQFFTEVTAQRRLDENLVITLQEMAAAMRSIRVLGDYLERNPNALLTGKSGDRR